MISPMGSSAEPGFTLAEPQQELKIGPGPIGMACRFYLNLSAVYRASATVFPLPACTAWAISFFSFSSIFPSPTC
jgi:hypothetical protein